MPNLGRGQSVADPCKGTRIPRERREAPSPHYLPGAGEGSSDLATPFHPSGDGSPGAPDGGGHGSGPPVHRGARHQQGAWRPTGARVLRVGPASRPVRGRSGRSGRMVVPRRRAELRLRSLGRFARHLTIEDVTGQALAGSTRRRCYDGTTRVRAISRAVLSASTDAGPPSLSVTMTPGAMALTRMWCGPNSAARAYVSCRKPPLLAS